jgi:prolyl 4-hydroxylase
VLQVLHYQEGEQYVEHWDYFHDAVNVKNGGQRVATALLYLSEVDEGAAAAG